ncbi:MAG: hypothetical protein COV08_01955, partial [Candidatus Vogelbacteria bacterium CG10_big_fil_rev_8_21_14_0_10_49_38]
ETLKLGYQLARVDFRLKNNNRYLGVLWYLIEPLIIFLVFLNLRGAFNHGVTDYPAYLLTGLILFNFFRQATAEASRALYANSLVLDTVKVSPEIFVLSAVGNAAFAHLFEFALLFGVLIWLDLPLFGLIFYPLFFFFFILFALGLSFVLAAAGLWLPDTVKIWGMFTRLLLFITPIFYSANLALALNLNSYNPLYHFISLARALIIGSYPITPTLILIPIFWSVTSLGLGWLIFSQAKPKFVELV